MAIFIDLVKVDSFGKEKPDKFKGVALHSVVERVAVGGVRAEAVNSPILESVEDP